jgi:hypothetical protein
MDDSIETNRRVWDERAALHAHDTTGFYSLDRFRAGESALHGIEAAELGDVRGKRVLHLQCHIGLDTLRLARLGAVATGLVFSAAASEAGLIDWEQAWAGEEAYTASVSKPRVFMPSLLTDTGVRFLSIQEDGGGIVGGGILNRGSEVVSLSNLFRCIDMEMVWRTLVATAVEAFPGRPLVAYERGHELAAAHQAGLKTTGHLRIWSLRAGAR